LGPIFDIDHGFEKLAERGLGPRPGGLKGAGEADELRRRQPFGECLAALGSE
jgi:hypothetical protein